MKFEIVGVLFLFRHLDIGVRAGGLGSRIRYRVQFCLSEITLFTCCLMYNPPIEQSTCYRTIDIAIASSSPTSLCPPPPTTNILVFQKTLYTLPKASQPSYPQNPQPFNPLSYKPSAQTSKRIRTMPAALPTAHIHALLTDMPRLAIRLRYRPAAEANTATTTSATTVRRPESAGRKERVATSCRERRGHGDAAVGLTQCGDS